MGKIPVGSERAEEIAEYIRDRGVDAAAAEFNLSRETIRRYMRHAKNQNSPADPIDNDKQNLLKRLADQYSEADLRALLNEPFKPRSRTTQYNFSGDRILIGVSSDWHVGSSYLNEDRIAAMSQVYKSEGVVMNLIAGDLTEGMSGRDGHIYELRHCGYKAQKNAATKLLSSFDFCDTKIISGNHDLWFASKANMGALIVEDVCQSLLRCEYLGEHEGSVFLNGARADLWHGEDGAAYALSYRIQKIVESIEGGTKPQMIFAGHDHKALYIPSLRNIQAVASGCVQHQTPWMRRKKLAAFCGFWLVELTIREGEVKRFKPEWLPFYK